MKIHLLAAGTRMPAWVVKAYDEYAKRLPKGMLRLIEVPVTKRTGGDLARALDKEGERMLAAAPARARNIALEVAGKSWSTEQVAARLAEWRQRGDDIGLMIGGPDGLAPACQRHCHETWSLSPLTLPHGLARVVVVEQLYRAWSILERTPYHRT